MSIDLKQVMSKKLATKQGAPVFKFGRVGDQLVFEYHEQRTVSTSRGEDAVIVDCEVLGGESFDPEKKKMTPATKGPGSFFASTVLRRLLSDHPPARGDVLHVQFTEVGKNDVKLYGFEVLERASRNGDASEPTGGWPQ
jgi:hypothetical protein